MVISYEPPAQLNFGKTFEMPEQSNSPSINLHNTHIEDRGVILIYSENNLP